MLAKSAIFLGIFEHLKEERRYSANFVFAGFPSNSLDPNQTASDAAQYANLFKATQVNSTADRELTRSTSENLST